MAFTGEHAQFLQLMQMLTVPVFSVIAIVLGYILKCLHELRADIKHEHDRFEAFVRNDNCKMHREVIERHIQESEARIERMLSHCKNHKGEIVG